MPFDGNLRDFGSSTPLELRLLDRTYDLIATNDQWAKGEFFRVDFYTGKRTYCLYGALLEAEGELVPDVRRAFVLNIGKAVLRARTQAFLDVHHALNQAARPWLRLLSGKETFAMHLNDRAYSVTEVHRIIVKARRQLVKQLAYVTA